MSIILYSDEDIEIRMDSQDEIHFIHTIVRSWSLSKYKKYLSIVASEMNKLKEKGINRVYTVSIKDEAEKWQKLFGFYDTGSKIQEYKLMRLDIWQQD